MLSTILKCLDHCGNKGNKTNLLKYSRSIIYCYKQMLPKFLGHPRCM